MTIDRDDVAVWPNISRTTCHKRELPLCDQRVLIPITSAKGSIQFAVAELIESASEGCDGFMRYQVVARGPVITDDGSRHPTEVGETTWRAAHDIPGVLRNLLFGPRRIVEARRIPGGWLA
jgi:hypothetical protein